MIVGAGEVRSRRATAEPNRLAEDVADLLETGRHVLSGEPVAGFWIGTARRKQSPVRPRKLRGLFAEPILTRSDFAGAAAYLLGEDDRIVPLHAALATVMPLVEGVANDAATLDAMLAVLSAPRLTSVRRGSGPRLVQRIRSVTG